jgi:chaperonin GroEL
MLPTPPDAIDTRQTPGIVMEMDALFRMRAGINQVVDALRPTLGPLPHLVAVETAIRSKPPEILDSGGAIARRIIDLPDKTENVGAMLVRGMVWKLHEQVGDGTVTAAILFQSLYDQGVKYLAAGGNPMLLRTALEQTSERLGEALSATQMPLHGQARLTGVAQSVCADVELADLLGECFHVLGEYGSLEIRSGQRGESHLEFVQGSYWAGGLHEGEGSTRRIEQEDAAILLTDLPLEDSQSLVPVLRAAAQAGIKHLFILSPHIAPPVLHLFAQSHKTGTVQLFPIKLTAPVKGLPHETLNDLALLTGGQALIGAAGYTWQAVQPGHFGTARRIWADSNYIGIVNGYGEPAPLRAHLDQLRHRYHQLEEHDQRQSLLERIGKLLGGAAILHVGGQTDLEVKFRKAIASRAASTLRLALHSGVIPGGGNTLLQISAACLKQAHQMDSVDSQAAWRMLQIALEAPFRTLLQNGGYDPGEFLGEIQRSRYRLGFDARTGQLVDLCQAGILDVAEVTLTSMHYAVRYAGLALTVDAVVHRRKPPLSPEPDSPGV